MKTQGSNSDITTKINKQGNKQLHIHIRISPINHLQSQGNNHNFNIAGIHFLETEILVKKFTFSRREIYSPLQGSRWQTCSEGNGSEIWPRAFPGALEGLWGRVHVLSKGHQTAGSWAQMLVHVEFSGQRPMS